jgi:hypothetical protein
MSVNSVRPKWKGWVGADFNLTCYWWGNESVWHWFPRDSIASLNLEIEANAEVGAWPKVGKAGKVLQQIP